MIYIQGSRDTRGWAIGLANQGVEGEGNRGEDEETRLGDRDTYMASGWCRVSPCARAVYQTAGAASLIPHDRTSERGEKNETTCGGTSARGDGR